MKMAKSIKNFVLVGLLSLVVTLGFVPCAWAAAPLTTGSQTPAVTSQQSSSTGDTIQLVNWERLWGSNQFYTMQKIIQSGWDSSTTAILATDDSFKDALSASSLAGLYKAPVLITKSGSLTSQTKQELVRLGVESVIIVGGRLAVSEAVERTINDMGITTERIWGSRSDDTAIAVAKRLGSNHSTTCFVAYGSNYRDALSISPYAYKNKAPIFLTRGKSITQDTLNAIKNGGFKKIIVLGGTLVIPDSTYNQIASLGISTERLWGSSAIDTSLKVQEWCVARGMSYSKMAFSTSNNYRDALCGAALCGMNNAVIALVNSKEITKVTENTAANKTTIGDALVLGGTKAISETLNNALVKSTTKANPAPRTSQTLKGWQQIDGKWYYYKTVYKKNSSNVDYYERVSGWMLDGPGNGTLAAAYYYFDKNGVMQTNKWITDTNGGRATTKTYVQSNGKMVCLGWVGQYHFDKYGSIDNTDTTRANNNVIEWDYQPYYNQLKTYMKDNYSITFNNISAYANYYFNTLIRLPEDDSKKQDATLKRLLLNFDSAYSDWQFRQGIG